MAKETYDNYFKAAQASPRGVVAQLYDIVHKLEGACNKQVNEVITVDSLESVGLKCPFFYLMLFAVD